MLSSVQIPNALYNSLPTVEEQSPPSQAHLEGLGKLLVSHGVSKYLGISLLHRHFLLPDESVMVHTAFVAPLPQPSMHLPA